MWNISVTLMWEHKRVCQKQCTELTRNCYQIQSFLNINWNVKEKLSKLISVENEL